MRCGENQAEIQHFKWLKYGALDVYDFTYCAKKGKTGEIKDFKEIGWISGNDKLSDSYGMYKNTRGPVKDANYVKKTKRM